MTDEIKTDAEKALADIKAETAKIDADASADLAKVKSVWQSHEVYFVAAIAFVAGAVLGHFL